MVGPWPPYWGAVPHQAFLRLLGQPALQGPGNRTGPCALTRWPLQGAENPDPVHRN